MLLLSCLKNQKAGGLSYSVGGVQRHRGMNERNRFRPGGPASSKYDLWRFTPFVDLGYNDLVSVRLEAIDASAFGYDAPLFPLGIDVNRFDLLQGYVDVKLADIGDSGSLNYRYGRQFLQYGSQHVLSSLIWANTFRNFEGHKLLYKNGDWAVDGFYMIPSTVHPEAVGLTMSASTKLMNNEPLLVHTPVTAVSRTTHSTCTGFTSTKRTTQRLVRTVNVTRSEFVCLVLRRLKRVARQSGPGTGTLKVPTRLVATISVQSLIPMSVLTSCRQSVATNSTT